MSPQLNGTTLEEASSESHLRLPTTITKAQIIKNETTKDVQGGWVPRSADDYAQLAVRNLVMDMCMQNAEIEVPGIEVTTGPLGQGIANAKRSV
ncbi:hypothetical protein M7I_8326 [Glarea lozoyensis 74030]|uniref:Transketolase N-terminal domain-containing protein n=1 Tax=Glarea lozoyensis (strain ATCC 74030 / MF5533) TaxID=1104152 RepID=H0EZQ0_GLAL7|nr:hypothetical protein M7I_8326 [Glarea lozoyensis 74030]